jgi:hypothetical protein
MTKDETLDAIAVMQAYAHGKQIEVRTPGGLPHERDWYLVKPHEAPNWNWDFSEYRIATVKPSIDWSHVAPEYRFLAVDDDERAHLYRNEPVNRAGDWEDPNNRKAFAPEAAAFASYMRGGCPYHESLVERPEGV